MMKILTLLLVTLFVSKAFSQSSQYPIIVEPYAGYNFGKYEIGYTTGAEDDRAEGPGVGAKIGTSINGVRASAEVMYSMLTLDGKNNPSKDAKHLIYGVHLGLPLPGGIQLFGGYFIRSQLKVEKSDADVNFPEDVTFKGKAYKAGASIPVYSDLNLKIEYIKSSFDKAETSTGTHSIKGGSYGKVDHSSVFVSLSYPLYLRGQQQGGTR